jgi:hypothetical protein
MILRSGALLNDQGLQTPGGPPSAGEFGEFISQPIQYSFHYHIRRRKKKITYGVIVYTLTLMHYYMLY